MLYIFARLTNMSTEKGSIITPLIMETTTSGRIDTTHPLIPGSEILLATNGCEATIHGRDETVLLSSAREVGAEVEVAVQ
jgi:hypothetical protein